MNEEKLHNIIMRLAEQDKEIDGHSGYPTERSAHHSVLEGWKAGLAGKIPQSLRRFEQEAIREDDPEFSEYKRLHGKFGGLK